MTECIDDRCKPGLRDVAAYDVGKSGSSSSQTDGGTRNACFAHIENLTIPASTPADHNQSLLRRTDILNGANRPNGANRSLQFLLCRDCTDTHQKGAALLGVHFTGGTCMAGRCMR